MSEESRLKKSIKNTVFGIAGMFALLIVSFIAKSVFIRELGNAYNGINYLFTGILQALNLAELGFASTVAFALYKPLSMGDEKLTAALMNMFKNVYRIIAVFVTVVGILCIPLLPYLIKEDMTTLPFTFNDVVAFYVLYILNTVFSYLLAYKRTIISADQNSYIVTTVDYSFNILLNILQIILLIVTKSYYTFLIIMISKTVINNVVLSIIANKKYPYLVKYKKLKLPKKDRDSLFSNVRAMFLHKLGGIIMQNTGTILVSSIVGVLANSLYGNYIMIAGQVTALLNIIYNSVTASVGNLCAEEKIEKQIEIFNNMNYLSLWIFYFVFICYVCLFNPFIDIWLGKNMTFNICVVVMISLNQCIVLLRKSVVTFKDAKGLFRVDCLKPIIESFIGISLAILLGHLYGVFGIMLGYFLGSLVIGIPVEQWALFRKGFNISPKKYVISNVLIFLGTGVVTCLMYFLTNLLSSGIMCFVIKVFMCLTIPNILFILATFKTSEFKYFSNIVKSILEKKNKRSI